MPEGQSAERLMGATERGALWMSSAGGHTVIERRLDPRLCDHAFRESLEVLKERCYPRLLPIGAERWSGLQYCLEYRLEDEFVELGRSFEPLHWRRRLEVVIELCRILPEWGQALVRPYGLNPLSLLVSECAGRRYPWLLACPPVKIASALDLRECDRAVLCCVAPEVIRGTPGDSRLVDAYSLGALAAMAMGGTPLGDLSDEEALEAQACGGLLCFDARALQVESFLAGMPELKDLATLIARYLEFTPAARPASAEELRDCCKRAVAATEQLPLAMELILQERSREALEVIEWGLATFGESIEEHLLAAELAGQLQDPASAVRHLDRGVELAPGDLGVRARRAEAAFTNYLSKPAPHPGDPDEEGDRLLKDLELVKLLPQEPGCANLPQRRAAAVHRHRGDLYSACEQLHEAVIQEPSDLDALYEYASCLRDVGDAAGERAAALQGCHRAERLALVEILSETEAARWKVKFQALLP
jgi:tetratricopeptide (TPR) repeat protein